MTQLSRRQQDNQRKAKIMQDALDAGGTPVHRGGRLIDVIPKGGTIGVLEARMRGPRKKQATGPTPIQDAYQAAIDSQRAKPATADVAAKLGAQPVPPAKLINHFVLLVDNSGSMGQFKEAAIRAHNDAVRTIQEAAIKEGQEARITRVLFGSQIRTPVTDAPIGALHPMTPLTYGADEGATRLYDALVETIDRVSTYKSVVEGADTSVLFIVITDGQANGNAYSAAAVKDRIRTMLGTGRWTFAFQVPPRHQAEIVRTLGVAPGNVMEWELSTRGLERASVSNNVGIQNFTAARALGQTRISSFYLDVDPVKMEAAKATMTDVRSRVRILDVKAESRLDDFVRSQGLTFQIGKSYYQLTKPEKIQHHKDILIREKNTRAVYFGPEARTALGLPLDGDRKVRPGNFGDWDIFVQSTSDNRKLVRGTKLVYVVS